MKIRTRDFRIAQGANRASAQMADTCSALYETDDAYEKMLTRHVSRLADLQELLYASDQYTLLVIFQGMDTSGKDGAIKHVMSGVNPQGCHVTSFKHPSATELQHDFLWRAVQALPERGCIGIFNRSYYERCWSYVCTRSCCARRGCPTRR
jgi:polyphosphate kinase 2 (PPK2 family)